LTSTQDSNVLYPNYIIDAFHKAVAIRGGYMISGYAPTDKSTSYYVRAISAY